jgi:hypothetical protein
MKEIVLFVAIADVLHSSTVCEGTSHTSKFKKIITSAKTVGPAYEPPCREQVSDPLLDSLSVEYNKRAFERLGEYKYDYGLAGASDGATAHHTSLANFVAIVCCTVVLLEVVDCTDSMAAGGTKDGKFIANEMCTQCNEIGEKFVFLVIFDGASNMQSPTMPLVLC